MQLIRQILAAITIAFVAASTMPASAQGTVVMVVDDVQVLRESKAGKDMAAKLRNIDTQIKNELEPTRKSLEAEGKAVQAKADGKTREALAADTAFVTQYDALQRKAADFAQKQQIAAQEMIATEQKALQDFNDAVRPALLEVVKERGAQVVLLKSQAVFTADAVDATAAVIAKLDAKTPTITVTRQRLPAQ